MKYKHILQALPILTALLGIAVITPAVSSAEEPEMLEPVTPTIAPAESKIQIDAKPDKLLYRVGETLDLTGLTVTTASGSGGKWEPEVSGQEITPENGFQVIEPDLSAVGIQKVKIVFAPKQQFQNQWVQSSEASFEITVTGVGDTDVNGSLDTADVKLMSRVLQGKEPLSGEAAVNADMNGDGEIDAFDLALMKRNLHEKVADYMTLTPTVRMDTTRDADKKMWEIAYNESKDKVNVLVSSAEMKTAVKHLPAAVSRSLLKTYDDAFFEENVLILHYDTYTGWEEIQEFSELAYENGKLTVTTKPKQTKAGREALMLWQIALPKEQYNGNGAVWTEQDTAFFKADYTVQYLPDFTDEKGEAQETLMKGVLVTDAEEELAVQELLNKACRYYDRKDFPSSIPDDDYQKNARFYRITGIGVGSEYTLWQTRRTGDRIIADVHHTAPTAIPCNPVYGLEVLTIPAEYAAGSPSVEIRMSSGGGYFDTDGTQCWFRNTLPDTPDLVVNPYHFGDEYEIAFYWRDYTGSLAEEFKFITSEAVSADASRFHDRDAKNGQILKDDAEGFSIEWGTSGVTISFMKSKSTGKPTLLHFPYPKQ